MPIFPDGRGIGLNRLLNPTEAWNPNPLRDTAIAFAASDCWPFSTKKVTPLSPSTPDSIPSCVGSHPPEAKTASILSENPCASGSKPYFTKPICCPLKRSATAERNVICSSVKRLFFSDSFTSSKSFSALAARSCCLASSIWTCCCEASASDAAFSRPAKSLVALEASTSRSAARDSCLAKSDFAFVRSESNLRSFASWRVLIMFPVISTPAPAAKVRNSSTTADISNTVFKTSTDTESLLTRVYVITGAVCGKSRHYHVHTQVSTNVNFLLILVDAEKSS
jgi:hypothetical protein